tara:strand:+ start:353 stop:664 length:312 start_codon:yes stop_codon:yes gene_type:complete
VSKDITMGKLVAKEKKKKKYKGGGEFADTGYPDTLKTGTDVYLLKPSMYKYEQSGDGPGTYSNKPYMPGDNMSFGDAFSWSRKNGADLFIWRGNTYTTKRKGE